MYKSKLSREISPVDLLPTVNVLLILLMLVIGGRPRRQLPMYVNPPLASSNLTTDFDGVVATILIAQGKVMLELPDTSLREQALKQMGVRYGISFSSAEISKFGATDIIGTPVHELKKYIKGYYNYQEYYAQTGIKI